MGVLDLLCVTTDPEATTFYGLAYAEDYRSSLLKPQCAVLVKSNTNPSSPTDLTWSVVSMFDGSHLSGYPHAINATDTSCSYSAKGVFTMFGRYSSKLSPTPVMVPFGIRYDPAGTMDPSFGLKGSGAWMNITVAGGFTWSGPFRRYSLGYTSPALNGVLIHASLSNTNNAITLATVDESTKILTSKAIWAMNPTAHGTSIKTLTIRNENLYIYGVGVDPNDPSFLTRFPLLTDSATTPIGTAYNTTVLTPHNALTTDAACFNSSSPILYVNHGSLTLICGLPLSMFPKSNSYTIDDLAKSTTILGPRVSFKADLTDLDLFVPIGPGTGNSSFALAKKGSKMFIVGHDGGFGYMQTMNNVTVPELLRSVPNPSSLPGITLAMQSSSPTSSLSTGTIVGIVAGVIVHLAGVILLLVWKYCIRRNEDDEITAGTVDMEAPVSEGDGVSISSEKFRDNDGSNDLYLEGKYADSSYPDWRTRSTDMLPMAPIAPVPVHLQAELVMLQEQMRDVQGRIQAATQFSSHPRPSVVTTVSYRDKLIESDVSEPGLEISSTTSKEPHEPPIFAQPAGSAHIADIHTPSAPAYSSVIS